MKLSIDKTLWKLRVSLVLARMWPLVKRLWRLIYPPTKRKIHRALHVAGMALTGLLMLAVWSGTKHHPIWKHVAETLSPLIPLLTSWRASLGWVERRVDASGLPSGDEVLSDDDVILPPSDRDDAVPEEADQLAVTGVHGKGNL